MMNRIFMIFPILFPVLCGTLLYFLPIRKARVRNIFTFAALLISALSVWLLAIFTPEGSLELIHFTDKISFTLRIDGAGKIFSCLAATLWPITAVYAFEYMAHEDHLGSFYAFFTMAFGAVMGVAYAEGIATMYLFYELLTLFTIPLVMHGRSDKSVAATKKYMLYSFGGAAFAFSCVAYLVSQGAQSFTLGGSLNVGSDATIALVLFIFAFFGFGVKAAIFPFHGWLPSASVAPTPVTALLHAVAVVKAGVFAVIRLIYYSYGTDVLSGTWAQAVAMIFAIITIFYGSSKALKQTHFKRRFAYSTVANLSYIIFAATLMTNEGLIASFTHMVFHSVIKICLFFGAGAVLHHAGKEHISELDGLGRKMPFTFAFFSVAAMSLVGIPPLCGFVSKWLIAEGAISHGAPLAIVGTVVLMISAFLTAIYALSVVIKAYFPKEGAELSLSGVHEAGWRMKVPMFVCALMCIILGVFSGNFIEIITKVVGI